MLLLKLTITKARKLVDNAWLYAYFVGYEMPDSLRGNVAWAMFEGDGGGKDQIFKRSLVGQEFWDVYDTLQTWLETCPPEHVEKNPDVKTLPVIVKEYIHFNVGRIRGNEVYDPVTRCYT
jgi:hypothetical protein